MSDKQFFPYTSKKINFLRNQTISDGTIDNSRYTYYDTVLYSNPNHQVFFFFIKFGDDIFGVQSLMHTYYLSYFNMIVDNALEWPTGWKKHALLSRVGVE